MNEETDKTAMEVIPPTDHYVAQAEAKSLDFMNPRRWQVMKVMAETFIMSGAVPESIKNAAQMMMVFQAGYEAGMQPLESLNAFYIVNGKLTMYGDAVTSQIIKAGHRVEFYDSDATKATCTITRGDDGRTMSATFTIEKAQERGLLTTAKGNVSLFWKKYPENMLKYKALGMIVDFIVPDSLRGIPIKETIDDKEEQDDVVAPLSAMSTTKTTTPQTQPVSDNRPSLKDALAPKSNAGTIAMANERANRLIELGILWDGKRSKFVLRDIEVTKDEVLNLTQTNFETLIAQIKEKIDLKGFVVENSNE